MLKEKQKFQLSGKKYLLLIVVFIYRCSYKEINSEHFVMYYDDAKAKVKMQGNIENGKEKGEWEYFSEKSDTLEKGRYENGLPVGNWLYKYEKVIDTSLNWSIRSINNENLNIKFSLPDSYIKDSSSTAAKHIFFSQSLSSIFSIEKTPLINDKRLSDWLNLNLMELKEDNKIVKKDIKKITDTSDKSYYNAEIELISNANDVHYVILYSILPYENESIVTSYVTSYESNKKIKIIYRDFIYHIIHDDLNVVSVLVPIRKLNNIIFPTEEDTSASR